MGWVRELVAVATIMKAKDIGKKIHDNDPQIWIELTMRSNMYKFRLFKKIKLIFSSIF